MTGFFKKFKIHLKKKKKLCYYVKKVRGYFFVKIYKVVGVNSYDFDNSKGEHVAGVTYHLLGLSPSSSDRFSGVEVEKVSVFSSKQSAWLKSGAFLPQLGDAVLPLYAKNGSLESFIDPIAVGLYKDL